MKATTKAGQTGFQQAVEMDSSMAAHKAEVRASPKADQMVVPMAVKRAGWMAHG